MKKLGTKAPILCFDEEITQEKAITNLSWLRIPMDMVPITAIILDNTVRQCSWV
jgi:hypothetical protein